MFRRWPASPIHADMGSYGVRAEAAPLDNAPEQQSWSVARERECVERSAHGDPDAVGSLYDAYVARLYRFCLARVGNESDAEDLAEEIFVKVLGAIGRFEWRPLGSGDRSPFAAWIFRIARNHVASFHRRAGVRGPSSEIPEGLPDQRPGPAELAETKLTIDEVFLLVSQLPPAQREVIELRFGAGLNVAETAQALGKQQANVKVLQHKGVTRLRELLAEQEATAVASRTARS